MAAYIFIGFLMSPVALLVGFVGGIATMHLLLNTRHGASVQDTVAVPRRAAASLRRARRIGSAVSVR